MKSLSLIHASWLKPFADYFAKRRVALDQYYEAAKIEPEQVTSGEGWITKQQLYGFLNVAAKGEKLPELGFVVGETLTPDKVAGLGPAIEDAGTLGEAIRAFCDLINRSSEENHAWLAESDINGELWLFNRTTNPFEADRRIADHAGLMTLLNLVRLAGGRDWYPKKIALQTGPTTAHRKVPGLRKVDEKFNHPATGLAFPVQWLLQPFRLKASAAEKVIASDDDLLEKGEALPEKMRRLLHNLVGVGGLGPSIKLIAELCGTSTRTLHRRLREVGVTYQSLLDEVRSERAMRQLRDTEASVKEIAFNLGYSGPNNFIRAFSRQTGLTPGDYRKGTEESTP